MYVLTDIFEWLYLRNVNLLLTYLFGCMWKRGMGRAVEENA